MNNLDYSKVFEVLVKETANYVKVNNLKAMVLGISGGIDSTVVAAICHEVSKQTGIPLIGRSLPIKNKSDEFDVSKLVGEALCNDFKVYKLERSYRAALFDACADAGDVNIANSYYLDELEEMPSRTLIANGNLQARCRMMYLYDIASRYKGLVMSTDNQTEYQLGFWTIHGDVGIPTYDVLMELSSRITDKELVIITTPETYREIPNWHNGSTILKDYKFIMVINGEEPPYGLPDNVSLVYVPTIRMCSTCIRNRVKDGVGIKPFVRDDVYEIIKQYKLYV